jgi:hypothetical protein
MADEKYTPIVRSLKHNNVTTKLTESEWTRYEEKRDAYKAKGYSNASDLAKYDILKTKGITMTKPIPKKED